MNDPTTHRCLGRGCSAPPTRTIEADVGLDGGLTLYFCEEHEAAFRRGEKVDFDVDRTEPEGAEQPTS